MKIVTIIIAIALLSGCEMTTEQITEKLAECKKAGLHADVYRMFGVSKVVDIQCVPENKDRS